MNNFKRIMLSNHTQEKSCLNRLYTDKQVYISSVRSTAQPIEEEKIYDYRELSFRFMGTNYRTPEKLVLFVLLPESMISCGYPILPYATVYEDYLLRMISNSVNHLSEEYKNEKKSARVKPQFSMQPVSPAVQQRNGCIYMEDIKSFRLRIHFQVPLINGTRINGKSSFKGVREILDLISDKVYGIEKEDLREQISLYVRQLEIRKYLKENHFAAFIANGSILPRKGDTEIPMEQAKPFVSPAGLEVNISLSDGSVLTGMGIRQGVTIITGGGYSGKSTLLNSLEMGIYHHRKGDGREYVITDDTACKIYAEDGRYVQNTDISPFFSHMPGDRDIHSFSTLKASGSVSQAVNIIEAVYGGSRLLLIDEDTSATNFMIRDEGMRKLVRNEPIIPFTDRIDELKTMGISTILVIGGSGEYLKHADTVLLMEDFFPEDKTEYVREHLCAGVDKDNAGIKMNYQNCKWTAERHLHVENAANRFFYSQCVQIENARYIKIDDYVADITKMTAVAWDGQINSITWLLEKMFMEIDAEDTDLLERCDRLAEKMFTDIMDAEKYF